MSRELTAEDWVELRRSSRAVALDTFGATPAGVLLPYQQQLLRTVAANSVTWCEKSRRTGATWALAADGVLSSGVARTAGGMDTLYIGYNLDMAREFIDACGDWARAFMPAIAEAEEFLFKDAAQPGEADQFIQAFRIRFASGFEITALSSKPRSLRGRQGKVIIDEAAFHDDLEELLKAAFALLIWGGKVVIISTHDGDENAFNEGIRAVRSGDRPHALVRFDFDDAIRDGLYERVCIRAGRPYSVEAEAAWRDAVIADYGDAADEELFCIPARGSGAWLTRTLLEARAIAVPVLRWSMPADFAKAPRDERRRVTADWIATHLDPLLKRLDRDLDHAFGMDFGRKVDRSVIWPVLTTRLLERRPPFVIELASLPFDVQEQILFHMIEALPNFTAGAVDAGGNGAELAERTAQEFGHSRIHQVIFSVDWYRSHMPPVKKALEDDVFAVPRDGEVIDDFRAFTLVAGVPRVPDRRAAKGGGMRHGDAGIAGALALFAAKQDVAEYDGYMSAAQLNDADIEEDDDFGRGLDYSRRGGL